MAAFENASNATLEPLGESLGATYTPQDAVQAEQSYWPLVFAVAIVIASFPLFTLFRRLPHASVFTTSRAYASKSPAVRRTPGSTPRIPGAPLRITPCDPDAPFTPLATRRYFRMAHVGNFRHNGRRRRRSGVGAVVGAVDGEESENSSIASDEERLDSSSWKMVLGRVERGEEQLWSGRSAMKGGRAKNRLTRSNLLDKPASPLRPSASVPAEPSLLGSTSGDSTPSSTFALSGLAPASPNLSPYPSPATSPSLPSPSPSFQNSPAASQLLYPGDDSDKRVRLEEPLASKAALTALRKTFLYATSPAVFMRNHMGVAANDVTSSMVEEEESSSEEEVEGEEAEEEASREGEIPAIEEATLTKVETSSAPPGVHKLRSRSSSQALRRSPRGPSKPTPSTTTRAVPAVRRRSSSRSGRPLLSLSGPTTRSSSSSPSPHSSASYSTTTASQQPLKVYKRTPPSSRSDRRRFLEQQAREAAAAASAAAVLIRINSGGGASPGRFANGIGSGGGGSSQRASKALPAAGGLAEKADRVEKVGSSRNGLEGAASKKVAEAEPVRRSARRQNVPNGEEGASSSSEAEDVHPPSRDSSLYGPPTPPSYFEAVDSPDTSVPKAGVEVSGIPSVSVGKGAAAVIIDEGGQVEEAAVNPRDSSRDGFDGGLVRPAISKKQAPPLVDDAPGSAESSDDGGNEAWEDAVELPPKTKSCRRSSRSNSLQSEPNASSGADTPPPPRPKTAPNPKIASLRSRGSPRSASPPQRPSTPDMLMQRAAAAAAQDVDAAPASRKEGVNGVGKARVASAPSPLRAGEKGGDPSDAAPPIVPRRGSSVSLSLKEGSETRDVKPFTNGLHGGRETLMVQMVMKTSPLQSDMSGSPSSRPVTRSMSSRAIRDASSADDSPAPPLPRRTSPRHSPSSHRSSPSSTPSPPPTSPLSNGHTKLSSTRTDWRRDVLLSGGKQERSDEGAGMVMTRSRSGTALSSAA